MSRLGRSERYECVAQFNLLNFIDDHASAVGSEVERDAMFAWDPENPGLFRQSLGPEQDGLQRFACHGRDRPRDRARRQALARKSRTWGRGVLLLALTQWLVGCVHPGALRGRRALDEQAYGVAALALQEAVKARPAEVSYWVDLGRAYVGEGRATDAVSAFQRARNLRPEEARLAIYLGHAHELARDYEQAEAAYRAGVALEPDRAWPHRVLGTRLLRWGRPEQAVAALREALARDPKHAETHHALAITYTRLGESKAAEATLRAALARFPKLRSLRLGLAALLVNRAEYEEALNLYAQVLEDAPDFAPAYVGRALLLSQLGRTREAEAELTRAVALDPRNAKYAERVKALEAATAE